MMDNAFFDYVSSSAVSLVVSGNTGLSPFLTLFLLGLVEAGNPELLNMGSMMETILASWWSIGILGILTLGETIGKCIPAIDELIDSAETFIVPVISVLASLATMGMLPVPGGGEGVSSDYNDDTVGKGEPIDVLAMLDNAGSDGFDGDYRLLDEEVIGVDDVDGNNDFGEAFMTFTKVALVITGIGLSLLIHMLKMLLRVSSLVCTGGCCQPCVTVLETVLVVFGVVCAILAPVFAIVACVILLIGAAYVIRTKCCNNKKQEEDDNAPTSGDSKRQKKKSIRATTSERNDDNDNNSNNDDIENQKPSSHNSKKSKRNTSITAATAPMDTMTEEAFAECEYNKSTTTTTTQNNNTNNPSAPPSSDYSYAVAEVVATLPPATAPANHHTTSTTKPDVEATMY